MTCGDSEKWYTIRAIGEGRRKKNNLKKKIKKIKIIYTTRFLESLDFHYGRCFQNKLHYARRESNAKKMSVSDFHLTQSIEYNYADNSDLSASFRVPGSSLAELPYVVGDRSFPLTIFALVFTALFPRLPIN